MAYNKKSKKNLKMFKKGEKRTIDAAKNQKRGVSIITALKDVLREGKGGITAEKLAIAIGVHIIKGNAGMAKIAVEHLDGKVPEHNINRNLNENYTVSKKEYAVIRKKMLKHDDC